MSTHDTRSHLHLAGEQAAQVDDTQPPSPAGRLGAIARGPNPRPTGTASARGASALPAQTLQQEIDATFTPWQSDPQRIARLLLWLDVVGESPRSVRAIAEFIRDPTPWSQQYTDMCVFEHPRPGEAS